MNTFDLIAFDLGNVLTLVDEAPGAARIASLIGRTPDQVFDLVFAPQRKVPLETGIQTWEEFRVDVGLRLGIEIPQREFREIFESVLTPNEAIFPLVSQVLASHRIALCSNTSEPHWRLEAGRLPFAKHFDPAVVSYEVGVMKPARRIYDVLSERASVPASRILFIDDREENVDGAITAGLHAIQFSGVPKLEEDLRSLGVL